MNKQIVAAFDRTPSVIPGYLEKSLAQRAELSGSSVGSFFENVTPDQLKEKLLAAEWETYSHPALMAGTVAFKAPLPGRLGVVPLAELPADTIVTLDDRKGTGKVSAVVKGVRGSEVGFTILILGPEKGEEVVFTFHPGDPVAVSQVDTAGRHGQQVTAAEAMKLGLTTAKIA